jgi:type IV pilus assembly protein PilO
MALAFKNVSLEDALAEFRGLNLNEPETWPDIPRYTIMVLTGLLVLVLGWQFYWSGKFAERDAARQRHNVLRQDFQTKTAQVANLPVLREQKKQVEQRVATLERQLPNRTEMDALLADVNQAGIARGLQFELFKPEPDVLRPYYAEIPVRVKVVGQYHEIAQFAADVAALSRIVTLQNLQLAAGKDGTLVMESQAKAFRALDAQEQEAQRKAQLAARKGAPT